MTTYLANYRGTDNPTSRIKGNYSQGPKGIYKKETTDVGTFPPNAFGLYDMHGNLWEWCQDTWHRNYNGAPTDGSAWIGNENGYRMLRGGSWLDTPEYCRSARRINRSPGIRLEKFGFRAITVLV
ncbi:MAG: formylglycine-generating enzyme family protein [Richelia sp.]|nr:formylglycine-generating enzyme family protein [Richelia sp.]